MDVNDRDDQLGAYALDAMEGEELGLLEAELGTDHELAGEARELHEAASWLGAVAARSAPADLRARMLDQAVTRRTPGRATRPAPSDRITPTAVLGTALADGIEVLEHLGPTDWHRPLDRRTWTVQEMVGHLTGVGRYVRHAFGLGSFSVPEGSMGHHVAMTEPTIAEIRGASPVEARTEFAEAWQPVVDRLRAAPGLLGEAVPYYTSTRPVGDLVTLRGFEVWAHVGDIRDAAGLPPVRPSDGALDLMCDLAVRTLPAMLTLAGRAQHGAKRARVVLTGPGGGSWLVDLGAGRGERSRGGPGADADALLVMDGLDFCRIAGGHVAPDAVDAELEGDTELAGDLLASLPVLAV